MRDPRQIAVVGVAGYSGLELARILLRHPALQTPVFYVRDANGTKCLSERFPQFRGWGEAPLRPLTDAGWIAPNTSVVCDCKSGASGAGKDPRRDLHFVEVDQNFKAYGVFTHRHTPEILEHTGLSESQVVFSTHLLPLARGILSTIYVTLDQPRTTADVEVLFRQFYVGRSMVRIWPAGTLPELHEFAHKNF